MENEIILKGGTLRHLQDYIDYKIKKRNFDDEALHERLLLLSEEVGELIKSCRKMNGMNVDQDRKIDSNVGEEIVDVINMVFAVAIELGIDVEKEFLEKESRIDKRVYKRPYQ